ncbi:family 43 glycosylhydrolase [Pontibacter sp. G13]|uniref:family 43 glycosylhydrolase n=1 Tax=Pontibacter sp. G13 TaxID=3074898 RepID=UPI00288B5505|nr:family 43 glycosylhydrolase [Pontibacter sp. G13]WNJ20548.1 family 43 glycosylhydrolase [Pontibacter sp. G13]
MKHLYLLLLPIVAMSCQTQPLQQESLPYGHVDGVDPKTQVSPDLKPLWDKFLRDTYVTLGPDGYYYLTGTAAFEGRETAFDENEGIPLWRSKDLENWEDLGYVWTFDDHGTWQRDSFVMENPPKTDINGQPSGPIRRSVWASEIHYLESQQNWFLVACVNNNPNGRGSFILKSTTGLPTGPYENIEGNAEGPLFEKIDGSLFEEEDGTVYFVGHSHWIAKMKPDMSGFAEPLRRFKEEAYDPEPYIEGAFIVKAGGKYHLMGAFWSFRMDDGSYVYNPGKVWADKADREAHRWAYDCVVATADSIYGPYSPRYTAVTGGGHNNFFQDKDGNWWSTWFGNPRTDIFPQNFLRRPALIPLEFDGETFFPKQGS